MPKPIRDLRIRLYDPRHDAYLRHEAGRRNLPESIVVRDALEVACEVWEHVEARKHNARMLEAEGRSRILERATMASARVKREELDPAVAGVLQPGARRSLDTPAEIERLLGPAPLAPPMLPAGDPEAGS